MKRILVLIAGVFFTTGVINAQDAEGGFQKENLFTGGSVTLSFFNGQTVLGANPMLGYKLADWVDGGVALNFLYNGRKDIYQYNDKYRGFVYGPGVFTRLYPVNFLFVQAQLEHNFTSVNYIDPAGVKTKDKVDATSLLLGGGYTQGRQPGSNSFFYVSILFDVLKNVNSPYVDVTSDPNNPGNRRVDISPIIRAGFNVGLFQGRYNNRYAPPVRGRRF